MSPIQSDRRLVDAWSTISSAVATSTTVFSHSHTSLSSATHRFATSSYRAWTCRLNLMMGISLSNVSRLERFSSRRARISGRAAAMGEVCASRVFAI